MKKISLTILGIPKPKQSVRSGVVYNHDGQPVMYKDKNSGREKVLQRKFQPKEVEQHEQSMKLDIMSQLPQGFEPFKGAIRINKLHYIFPPLKSFSKSKMRILAEGGMIYKPTKPDVMDNLSKGLMDVLEGIVFLNDSQIVCAKDLAKFYGRKPRIEIELEEIDQVQMRLSTFWNN